MFFFSKGNCRRLSWRGPPVWRPGACGGAEGRSAGFGKGVWAAQLPSPYPALFLPAEPPFVREQQKSVRRFRVSAWCRLNPAPWRARRRPRFSFGCPGIFVVVKVKRFVTDLFNLFPRCRFVHKNKQTNHPPKTISWSHESCCGKYTSFPFVFCLCFLLGLWFLTLGRFHWGDFSWSNVSSFAGSAQKRGV